MIVLTAVTSTEKHLWSGDYNLCYKLQIKRHVINLNYIMYNYTKRDYRYNITVGGGGVVELRV